ncbi:MAG: hypothetical protein ACK587_15305 [Cyanobacteriota bacterium]
MANDLCASLARCAAQRGHIAAAEGTLRSCPALRRRYWREMAAAAALVGEPWPEAEILGVEP